MRGGPLQARLAFFWYTICSMQNLFIILAVSLAVVVGLFALALFFIARLERARREEASSSIEALRREFSALTVTALSERARDISRDNAERLAPLFDSMRADFTALRNASDAARRENAVLAASLKDRLAETLAASRSLSRQADEFVSALKSSSKLQGNWGEGILTKVLEDAGLREGINFAVQTGSRDAGLPDVTIFDGNSRRILIDAKVNISDFIAGANAMREGRDEEAAAHMRDHAKSVRAQVTSLAARKYPEKLRAADPAANVEYSSIVIMFMPSEATYAAAVTADPALIAWANTKNVVIASPQMLFGYLVLFKLGLDRLQVDRNNQEIAKRAKQILERLDSAFVALEDIGKSLEKATVRYHDALRRLGKEEGGQNIVTPARELVRLTNSAEKRSSAALAVPADAPSARQQATSTEELGL